MRKTSYSVGFLMIVLSLTTSVAAGVPGPAPVPEIDGASLSAGLGLLAGGVLMLRARFGRK